MQHYNSLGRLRTDSLSSIAVPNWFFSLKRTKKLKRKNDGTSRSAWDLTTMTGAVKRSVGNATFFILHMFDAD